MKLVPIILAGGGGTRLWPLSREHYPKQFLSLYGEQTLLQGTLLRLQGLTETVNVAAPVIICNEVHRFLVMEQSAQVASNVSHFILEPVGRNTAPALTIAAIQQCVEDDAIMVMMPADHIIKDTAAFQTAITAGVEVAYENKIVTFGITPISAETGYGYIHMGAESSVANGSSIHAIEGFTEKPDKAVAETYLNSGEYLWNSGIFMMKASVWLEKLQQYAADIYGHCKEAYENGETDGLFYRLETAAFEACPADSIDYAVMEKLAKTEPSDLAVIPLTVGWSDVGAWSSVWDINEKDDSHNVLIGDVITEDSRNCYVKSDGRLVVAIGCEDMVIVDTDDATMISAKDKTQDVKKVVEQLKKENRTESFLHRKVYRPWGSYDSVDMGEKFQVKRLTLKPGKKLSLQLHHQRAEHWVVVRGIATVTRGEDVLKLKENESIYIPVGTKHRLENATDELLELIEVQTGNYLGEDDIVRFDDDFGRS